MSLVNARAFPSELELGIFTLAAHEDEDGTNTALNVVQVARRAQIWIEPIIYNSIFLAHPRRTSQIHRVLESRGPAFFATHVKTLHIKYYTRESCAILQACKGLVSLWCDADAIGRTTAKPTNLYIDMENKRRSSSYIGDPPTGFRSSLFANVTHLYLTQTNGSWSSWKDLGDLRGLTHLAVWLRDIFLEVGKNHAARRVKDVTEACGRLEVMVLLFDGWIPPHVDALDEVQDPRLVLMQGAKRRDLEDDWHLFTSGGREHMWDCAEAAVERHRCIFEANGSVRFRVRSTGVQDRDLPPLEQKGRWCRSFRPDCQNLVYRVQTLSFGAFDGK